MIASFSRSHLDRITAMGFVVHAWLNRAVMVEDGAQSEWLPRLMFAPTGDGRAFRVVEFRAAADNGYAFDGWTASHGPVTGGTYADIHSALSWFDWFDAQRQTAMPRRGSDQVVSPVVETSDLRPGLEEALRLIGDGREVIRKGAASEFIDWGDDAIKDRIRNRIAELSVPR